MWLRKGKQGFTIPHLLSGTVKFPVTRRILPAPYLCMHHLKCNRDLQTAPREHMKAHPSPVRQIFSLYLFGCHQQFKHSLCLWTNEEASCERHVSETAVENNISIQIGTLPAGLQFNQPWPHQKHDQTAGVRVLGSSWFGDSILRWAALGGKTLDGWLDQEAPVINRLFHAENKMSSGCLGSEDCEQ